jgi:membrane glycosyltransferase
MSDASPPAPAAATVTALRADRHPDFLAQGLTPAGLQPRGVLLRRRLLVLALNLGSIAAFLWAIGQVFGAGGWTFSDMVVWVMVLIGSPWMIMGAWNALIGLWVLHGPGPAAAFPALHDGDGDEPIRVKVAVTMFMRNEDPRRALRRLAEIRRSLDETGQGAQFELFALSDTNDPAVAEEEERVFAEMKPLLGATARYRRRAKNEAWKAGNVRDFLRRWGDDYDLYLPLDSDSLMSGRAILRLTRIMQKHPRLGILQSLVVGAPSDSLFARIFQFGMRHGMRSYTAGATWWHGDSCGYWGHNALIRTRPFKMHCRLPVIPGEPPLGGHILSHDQIEATLMRRAGYEVRILPVEIESFEDNPPTIFDFIKRDHRWCNGNMQYWNLLRLKGITGMSRFQIAASIAMYFSGPAWVLMILAATAKIFQPEGQGVSFAFGVAIFFISFSVSLMPKIAGWIDVALTPGATKRYGGGLRFGIGAVVETVFSMILAPLVAFAVTVFMVGLAFGKRISWSGQQRDLTRISLGQATRRMWPQTLLGLGLTATILAFAPGVFWWASPMLAGFTLAIPFTALTASPWLGRLAARVGLCATPEEITPIETLTNVFGPAAPAQRRAA